MKQICIPALAFTLAFLAACGPSPADSPGTAAPAAGGANVGLTSKTGIDSLVVQINESVSQYPLRKFRPNLYSGKDAIAYSEMEGQVRRMTCSLYKQESEVRDYFYLKDGKVVYYRHLEWLTKGNTPSASEFVCYLLDNGQAEALERRVELAPGEMPGRLMQQEQKAVVLNADSLAQAVQSSFEAMKATAEKSELNNGKE